MASAVIVAAGTSQRMGFDKLMAPLCGKPVLIRSILAFEHCSDIQEIILVLHESRQATVEALLKLEGIRKVTEIVPGGATRQQSVINGLNATSPKAEIIAIHDGARPLVQPSDISLVIAKAKTDRAATLAHPIVDTIKRADKNGQITAPLDREGVWAMETPQVFQAALIRHAATTALTSGTSVTDEVSAVESLGVPIFVVASTSFNPKITFPTDLALAEKLILPPPISPQA